MKQNLQNQQKALHDTCETVYRKEAHCTECIHAISPYGSWVTAVSSLLIRQKSITAGDKLQKLFFPSLLKSAKYLLKCAAHSEAKLEVAAAPSASSRLAICSSLPQPWVLRQGLSPQKNSHLFPSASFFSLHVYMP